MRVPEKGSIVKFIGRDGKSAFTKIIAFQERDLEICAGLEVTHGTHKGFVGLVPLRLIEWNGSQFVADLRDEGEETCTS